jgi:uncharacterized protein (TIGR00304 family)
MFIGNARLFFSARRGVALDVEAVFVIGFVLLVLGVIIVAVSLILTSSKRISSEAKAEVRGAGVIMIGPMPIIFGNDKKSVKEVLVLALALTVTVLILTLVFNR